MHVSIDRRPSYSLRERTTQPRPPKRSCTRLRRLEVVAAAAAARRIRKDWSRCRWCRDTAFTAAARLVQAEGCQSVAVLDFASDSEPGGGWRGSRQQGTQGETLCRASSLGHALEQLPYPLPTYGDAVVPEVVVFRTDDR